MNETNDDKIIHSCWLPCGVKREEGVWVDGEGHQLAVTCPECLKDEQVQFSRLPLSEKLKDTERLLKMRSWR